MFIEANPTYVTVTRPVRTPTGTGGVATSSTKTLPPQCVRIVSLAGQPRTFTSATGAVLSADSAIIALPSADFEVDDVLEEHSDSFGSDFWRVLAVARIGWRLEATVIRHG
jgi:hypothetical protein